MELVYFAIAGIVAGVANALAGGGPIITLGAMSVTGIDPRIASLTSTLALSPGQVLAGWACRKGLASLTPSSFRLILLVLFALVSGALGGVLLLQTQPTGFRAAVPWLVLFATAIYWWSGRPRKKTSSRAYLPPALFMAIFGALGVYGGYFGGGNALLVLALLASVGLAGKDGAEAKNSLIAAINVGAVGVFAFSGLVHWPTAAALAFGGMVGSWTGVRLLSVISPDHVRPMVITFGLALAIWFFAT